MLLLTDDFILIGRSDTDLDGSSSANDLCIDASFTGDEEERKYTGKSEMNSSTPGSLPRFATDWTPSINDVSWLWILCS